VQDQVVVEVEEEVLPVGSGGGQNVAVQQGGAGGEPALGTGNRQFLPRENVTELARQAVDGVPFRHYWTTSPVRS
jgi:hypothetical protein